MVHEGFCEAATSFCNGVQGLINWSDIQNSAEWTCPDGCWKCSDNLHCVQELNICDGVINCKDGSDEKGKKICGPQNSEVFGYFPSRITNSQLTNINLDTIDLSPN